VYKPSKKTLIYFAVAALFLLFFSTAIPTVRPQGLNLLKIPLVLINFVRREFYGIVFYHSNMVQKERFKRDSDYLRQRLNTLNEIAMENQRLKSLLSLKQRQAYRLTAARVIARQADNWSSMVIIDKGSFNGINKGMAAITYRGLIGKVMDTSGYTSRVMLINDANFAISAINQRSRQEGLVSGTLGGSIVMRYLPQEADIMPQDAILTSGLSGDYPKGLLIGTVTAVAEEFSGLSRIAIIKPAVDLSGIEEVLLVAS